MTEEEIRKVRKEKGKTLLEKFGIHPFCGESFTPSHSIREVVEKYSSWSESSLKEKEIEVAVAGRIIFHRSFGKAGFIVLKENGFSLQIHIRKDLLSPREFEVYRLSDIGDFIGVKGTLFRTRTGELTVSAKEYRFLTKAIRNLPEKWHGLTDVELRHRERYLDLLVNPQSRERFIKRSVIVKKIRQFWEERGFQEVETPMLHLKATGARAHPFNTFHNALHLPLILRIAPELFLKRLVVGGMDKIFELNRSFRNEGISSEHNPEFTMLEVYEAYGNLEKMMGYLETLLYEISLSFSNGTVTYLGKPYSFHPPFPRIPLYTLLKEKRNAPESLWDSPLFALPFLLQEGKDLLPYYKRWIPHIEFSLFRESISPWFSPPEEPSPQWFQEAFLPRLLSEKDLILSVTRSLTEKLERKGEDLRLYGGVIALVYFEEEIEDTLEGPLFVTHFPLLESPLAHRLPPPKDHLTERFELFVAGKELANGFQELNDPEEQRTRFLKQGNLRFYGDLEAMELDEEYLKALEYGLPPTVGAGVGIDRLVMIFTNAESIRDVILFPLLRPRKE